MRMAIEVFALILVISLSCILFSSMISVSVQNSEARDFYNVVRNRIEDSNMSSDVIEECKAEADKKGYELEIEDVSVYKNIPSMLVRMKHSISIPAFKLFGEMDRKEGIIEGYAR